LLSFTLLTTTILPSAAFALDNNSQATDAFSFIVPEFILIDYGTTKEIQVAINNYDPSKPMTLSAVSDFANTANITAVSKVDATGNATITVSGDLPGSTDISLHVAEIGLETTIHVQVKWKAPTLMGDVNGDGIIDLYDAILIHYYYRGRIFMNADERWTADVNRDNVVDLYDANLIYYYFRGKINSFPY